MDIRKPKRISLSAQIVAEMERIIRYGQWKVGQRIPAEPELMALFDVSRNTVREAVQALIHAGLLQAKPGDGTYVVGRSRLEILLQNQLIDSEISKVLEARLALESAIAALASQNRTEEDITELGKALDLRNLSDDLTSDTNFHLAVAKSAHNPLLENFYNEICLFMLKNMVQKLPEGSVRKEEINLHNRLYEAIVSSNAEAAKDVTYEIVGFYSIRLASK